MRRHLGECKPRACFNCGSHDHLRRNCTQPVKGDRKTNDALIPARVFALTEPAAAESKTVVAGQLTSAGTSLTVLFDSGATHSFISTRLVDQLCRPGSKLDRPMHIILPCGERVVSRRGIRALPLTVDGRKLHIDVIELEIDDFDLILGMHVLEKYGANINCKTNKVTFSPEGEMPFVFLGTILISRVPRISALKARELLQQGCVGYLAHVVDTNRTETSGPGETRVVCDFVVQNFLQ